eukprot:gene21357-23433_t
MQPTPPKSKKPQYKRPFYDAGKKTSAEIIAEARRTVRPVEAARPFTPSEPKRSLFGAARPSEGRPPSAFSIGPSAFAEPGTRVSSRPPTGRLTPLTDELLIRDTASGLSSSLQDSIEDCVNESLDVSSQGGRSSYPMPVRSKEPTVSRGQHMQTRPGSQTRSGSQMPTDRRVQSGPKDRTSSRNEEKSIPGMKKCSSMSKIERKTNDSEPPFSGRSTQSSSVESGMTSTEQIAAARRSKARPSSMGNAPRRKNDSSKRDKSMDENTSIQSYVTNSLESNTSEDRTRPDSSKSDSGSENDNQNQLFKESIEPLLKQMELNYLHADFVSLGVNFDVLWKTLELCNLLGKGTGSSAARKRAVVLRTIFKFVDSDSAEVILKLCKLALSMKVTGKNIVNICKLIFKISKDKSKDQLFKEERMISHLLNLLSSYDVIQLFDGILYAVGSVKFLSVNPLLHEEFLNANCFQCFGILLRKVKQLAAGDATTTQVAHLLVQASAAIRNLADIPNTRSLVAKSGILENLLSLLKTFWKDADYMLNVSRILSKLSQYGDCCRIIYEESSHVVLLLDALKHYSKTKDIAVRLLFTFGNIAAKLEESRSDMHFEKRSLDVFLGTLEEYMNITTQLKENAVSESDGKELEKSNEILVKTIRVIANLSIDPNVALDVANNERFLQLIVNIIGKNKFPEELLINCAATLNNLSYFSNDSTRLHCQAKDLTTALIQLLFVDNMDCIIEATRVFGNFTQSKDIRTLLREKKEEETEDLLQILQEYLDPDIALDYSEQTSIDSETRELMGQTWTDQFEQVALRLYSRIEENHTALEPLEIDTQQSSSM